MIMKTKLILITGALSITSILYGNRQKESHPEGVSSVVITNDTGHKLKVMLQSKNKASNLEELSFAIPAEAKGDDGAVKFNKVGNVIGYKGSEFSVEIVNQRMGVHTENWTGKFTGEDAKLSHTFEYRAVVQHPVKIMSTINLKMIVTYRGSIMNILFLAPQEELDN